MHLTKHRQPNQLESSQPPEINRLSKRWSLTQVSCFSVFNWKKIITKNSDSDDDNDDNKDDDSDVSDEDS